MPEQVSIEAVQAPLEPSANGGGTNGAVGAAAAERPFVRDLAEGQEVTAAFAVRERERRTRRTGDDFLRLVVADRTGTVEAVAWEAVDDLFGIAEPGAVVRVEGRFSVHPQYGAKITLRSLRRAGEGEFDSADLVEGPDVALARLESDLRELIATIQNRQLRRLLDVLLGEDAPGWPRFRDAPAAKYYHEAYRHGLLHHTVTMAQAVNAAASAFPGVDRDVAVTGALLHDIGKTRAYNDDPLAIDLTDAGRLQGEIALGYYIVRRAIESIDGFEPALGQAILHIILSHHGSYQNGSPVVPATREATLVHSIDNLGGKLGSFDRIERELPDGEAWSRFDRGIESAAFFPARAA